MTSRVYAFFVFAFICMTPLLAQDNSDTSRHLYRPQKVLLPDTNLSNETSNRPGLITIDTNQTESNVNHDSIDARNRFIQDSINARLLFIQDSIIAREAFIRDSIAARQRILDSLNVLKAQIPKLLDASLKAVSDQIIYRNSGIQIVGDSMLSNYTSYMLTFDFSSPYTPWKTTLNLSDKPPKIVIDPGSGKITSIQSSQFSCDYTYGKRTDIIVLRTKGSIMSKNGVKLYKEPIDSVFFNQRGAVIQVKKYIQFYQVVNNFQRGGKMFAHKAFVKQFEYNSTGQITLYKLTKFCDRWKIQDPVKVCTITAYNIEPKGNTYLITRHNNPENEFSDGVFTYEFKADNTLSSVTFQNNKNTENWKTIIEVNDLGNVTRYLYENKGIIRRTLLVNYYPDDPKAKHKVETITCTFEEDGVSYYQKNNTTGKSRSRTDRLTLEWGPWQ